MFVLTVAAAGCGDDDGTPTTHDLAGVDAKGAADMAGGGGDQGTTPGDMATAGDLATGETPDLATVPPPDLATTPPPDLATTPPPDLATPPDLSTEQPPDMTAAICGNGVQEGDEQCDDGNSANLDGCDSSCKFEQVHRITSLQMQFASDATVCPQNQVGAAFSPIPELQQLFQQLFDSEVHYGQISIVTEFVGLTDLSGQDSDPFKLAFFYAPPVGVTSAYTGEKDLDWWYKPDPAYYDAQGNALWTLDATLSGRQMVAGPGTTTVGLVFGGSPATVRLYDAVVRSTIDAEVAAPTVSTGGPPGHLASENIAAGLTSFTKVSGNNGSICAKASAKSFADTILAKSIDPSSGQLTDNILVAVCSNQAGDMQRYTDQNSLLDVFIGGCLLGGQTPIITTTQPDGTSDGSSGTYAFIVDPTDGNTKVTGCTKDGVPASLDDCLAKATYSSFFKFSTDRVILTPRTP